LQARRGRRCGVEVHGGALLRSGPPSVTLASFPVRLLSASSSSRSNAPAAARVGLPPRLLFPNSPLLLPPPTAALGRGKNPNAGRWRWPSGACPPPAFESAAPHGQGDFPVLPPRLGPPGARGGGARPLSVFSLPLGHGTGVKQPFLPPALARPRPAPRERVRRDRRRRGWVRLAGSVGR
jgi:hypothetical protein